MSSPTPISNTSATDAYAFSRGRSRIDPRWRCAQRPRPTFRRTASRTLPISIRTARGSTTPRYGNVWYPTVAADWRPYYYGYWSSVPSYGWTWIGYNRWAWPTHHYGRWGYASNRWFWIPGRAYSSAWVSWGTAPGYVSWCPLGFDSRPVVGLSVGYSHGWNAWTIVPRDHFGWRGYPAHRYAVEPHRIAATTPFIVHRSQPALSVRGAGSYVSAQRSAAFVAPRGGGSGAGTAVPRVLEPDLLAERWCHPGACGRQPRQTTGARRLQPSDTARRLQPTDRPRKHQPTARSRGRQPTDGARRLQPSASPLLSAIGAIVPAVSPIKPVIPPDVSAIATVVSARRAERTASGRWGRRRSPRGRRAARRPRSIKRIARRRVTQQRVARRFAGHGRQATAIK